MFHRAELYDYDSCYYYYYYNKMSAVFLGFLNYCLRTKFYGQQQTANRNAAACLHNWNVLRPCPYSNSLIDSQKESQSVSLLKHFNLSFSVTLSFKFK
jgi:hypothetical protein